MSSTLKNRGRGRSPSPRVHSPNLKSRSLSPYRVSTLDRLESELENLELIHRKEVEQWLTKHSKPTTEKEIDDRMRAIDMEEEYKIYDGFSDSESTWHKKLRLKRMIEAERAKTKGGRKTRRKYKNKKR